MATLKEIADEAGVSVKTVSNILNGNTQAQWPSIAARARRVREIAEQMKYTPNFAARNLRTGRKGKVAILSGPELGFFPTGLFQGLSNALAENNLSLILSSINAESDPRRALEALAVDGVIISDSSLPYLGDQATDFLKRQSAILLNHPTPKNAVAVADREGAETLVREVIARSGRPVAFLSTACDVPGARVMHCLHERLAGYRDALAGTPQQPIEHLPESLLQKAELRDFVNTTLQALPRPCAVFVHEPWEVYFLHNAALQHGLKIPQDILPVCLDTHELWSRPVALPMVAAHFHWALVGKVAIKMLLKRIERPHLQLDSMFIDYNEPRWYGCEPLFQAPQPKMAC
jgi:DNA-binding LacI/PurR family transcriptional regulator